MCGKLAAKLKIPPQEIYRHLIKSVGENFEITPIRDDALDFWIANWERHGIGWVCEILGKSKLDGYTNVINYYGSSVYDSSQMSRLVDLIIQECKAQGIETATPEELALYESG